MANQDLKKIRNGYPKAKTLNDIDFNFSELEQRISEAAQTVELKQGTANGTMRLDIDGVAGEDVSVKGLGSAAFADTTAFDAAGAANTAKSDVIGANTDTYSSDTVYGAKKYADKILSDFQSGSFSVVQSLSSVISPQGGIIYLVPKTAAVIDGGEGAPAGTQGYVEWIYINTSGSTYTWEQIGDTDIDLSGYSTKEYQIIEVTTGSGANEYRTGYKLQMRDIGSTGAWTDVSSIDFTTELTKLRGIEAGAQVNVKANWNETDSASDAFIQNKPVNATTSTAGLMSAEDKTFIESIKVNPVGSTIIKYTYLEIPPSKLHSSSSYGWATESYNSVTYHTVVLDTYEYNASSPIVGIFLKDSVTGYYEEVNVQQVVGASFTIGETVLKKLYLYCKPQATGSNVDTLVLQLAGFGQPVALPTYDLSITNTNATVTVTRNGSPVSAGTDVLTYGDVITVTASVGTGYELTTLTLNGVTFTSGNTHTVTGNVTIVAVGEAVSSGYNVYVDTGSYFGEGSGVKINGTFYEYSSDVTFPHTFTNVRTFNVYTGLSWSTITSATGSISNYGWDSGWAYETDLQITEDSSCVIAEDQ